ncbi:hypothetical protein EDF67_101512 [Sphingobacterium sp. JUb78]|nr:hypothetical protein [Sphingobacterium kitahiroshimense]TCR14408.1 hypothetical protein EDF67_101512 [Sphingobacterium sp. JUb78]
MEQNELDLTAVGGISYVVVASSDQTFVQWFMPVMAIKYPIS